ncbi:MAG: HupE/UreJ family protein [Planctomycetota bacterium]
MFRTRLLLLLPALLVAALFGLSPFASASGGAAVHGFNQSYTYLRVDEGGIEGRIEVNLSDLNRAVGTEFPTDLTATEADITPEIERIEEYLYPRIGFALNGAPVELERDGFGVYEAAGNQYVSCRYKLLGVEGIPDAIDVTHNVLFEVDPEHRGFLVIEHYFLKGTFMNEGGVSLIFEPGETTQTLDLTGGSRWQGIRAIIKLGIHHILIGIDHILFLIVLLLPSVLRRREDDAKWEPQEKFSSALWQVLKIVTVFTLAHSVTLSLAALNIVSLPSRIVESIIAISIAVAALDVFFPIFRGKILLVVLLFGFFHGFGFANVLGEMGISGVDMAWSLFGFNVGVEIGQMMIVLLVFPMLFMMRLSLLYTRFFVYFGAFIAGFISVYWFIERFFEVNLTLGEWLGPILNMF